MSVRQFIRFIRVLTAGLYVVIGVMHFVRPEPFIAIVPPYIPEPAFMVFLSGGFEVLGGLGLLVRPLRRISGWGLIALTVVVFQANIYMAVEEIYLPNMPHNPWLLYVRLPLQFVFLAMIWFSMKDERKYY